MGCEGVGVVGVDLGLTRSVFSVVGDGASDLFSIVVGGLEARGVPVRLIRANGYFVFDVTYPSVDYYRGSEVVFNLFERVVSVIRNAFEMASRWYGVVTALSLENLLSDKGLARGIAKTWRLLLMALYNNKGAVEEVASYLGDARASIWCYDQWLTYNGHVLNLPGSNSYVVLVSPEYSSSLCPSCTRYLGPVRRGVEVVRPRCGFRGDADVVGSLNIAARGCCVLRRYLGGKS